MLKRIPAGVLSSGCLLAAALFVWNAQGEDFDFFEQHIRPVLVDNCYKCHSAGSEKVKGGLLLDTREGTLKGGDTGPAIVPGKPEESLLIKAIRYGDKDLQMPPKDKRLAENQIADLVTWVKMGAPDPRTAPAQTSNAAAQKPAYDFATARRQWAFHTPEDPPVPEVKNKRWAKSPIDHFILAKLEEMKLKPAPEATKRVLIRRATFDLTGLPPTPQEVDAFLRDKSPDAFAKVVDRLLASPHYGERWGRHWLDVTRYTDSLDARGIGSDGDVAEAWRYRDWVVNAFNEDLPYDKFIIQQIAGDLIQPKDTNNIDTNAIIATGMYAIGNWGNGDADKEKILTDIADDQVDVTGRAFLGLTIACARCHDHKFDPIPTADYYSLAGIFFSSHILPKLTPKGVGEILMRIPLASRTELERRKEREARMAELDKQIASATETQLAALAKRLLPQTGDYLMAVEEYQNRPKEKKSLGVAAFAATKRDGFQPVPELLQQWMDYLGFGEFKLLSNVTHDLLGNAGLHALRNANNADTPSGLINATGREISFSTIKMPPRSVAIHPSPSAGVAVGWKSPITGTIQIKGWVSDADPNCGDGIEWTVDARAAGNSKQLASGAIPNGGAQQIVEGKGASKLMSIEVREGDMIQLVVLPKGDYSCDTTVVELNITEKEGQKREWSLTKDMVSTVQDGRAPYPDHLANQSVWYLYDMDGQTTAPGVAAGSPVTKWLEAVRKRAPRNEIETAAAEIQRALLAPDATNSAISKFYQDLTTARGAFWTGARNLENYFPEEARKELLKQEAELAALKKNTPPPVEMALGLQDGGVPESPQAGIHDVKIHMRGRYDRLGDSVPRRFPRLLAGDDQKPIVEGSGRLQLGEWIANPKNPLTARVMINRIWQHHFGEGIVRTPNNYGKLGTPPTHPELLDYLAHRFVDSGWSIKAMHRAIMLSATYQQSSVPEPATLKADPDNLLFGHMSRRRLESEALRDSLLEVAGKLDPAMGGPSIRDLNINRRTLYVTTVRSDRATYQFLFDAADPNAIVEKRIDSTVAPQALFLLNHPFALDQTKALAQRVLKEASGNDKARIEWLYRSLYGRPASRREIEIGLRALARTGGRTKTNEKTKSIEAAWEEYCQVLVCANEFIYVD